MTMQSYLAGRTRTAGRTTRLAGAAVLAVVGMFLLMAALAAAGLELDDTGRPAGTGVSPAFLAMLAVVTVLAVTVPVLVGRRVLRRPPHIYAT